MLDLTVFRELVEQSIRDNFTTCPVKFENTPLPKQGGKAPKEYIAVFDMPSFSGSTGMNESAYLYAGVMIFQIFTPLNTGTARSRAIAKDLNAFLQQQEIEGINFGTPELHPAPKNDSWYQQNLQIPYTTVMGQEYSC